MASRGPTSSRRWRRYLRRQAVTGRRSCRCPTLAGRSPSTHNSKLALDHARPRPLGTDLCTSTRSHRCLHRHAPGFPAADRLRRNDDGGAAAAVGARNHQPRGAFPRDQPGARRARRRPDRLRLPTRTPRKPKRPHGLSRRRAKNCDPMRLPTYTNSGLLQRLGKDVQIRFLDDEDYALDRENLYNRLSEDPYLYTPILGLNFRHVGRRCACEPARAISRTTAPAWWIAGCVRSSPCGSGMPHS